MINRVGSSGYNPYAAAYRPADKDAHRTPFPAPGGMAPAPAPAAHAPRSGQPMPVRRLDEIGWAGPQPIPDNADDLAYNVYTPDGVAIIPDGVMPFRLAATGETITDAVRARLRQQVNDVATQRIELYKQQKAAGKTNAEIRQALLDFDARLPADYRQLTGLGGKIDASTRYDQHRPDVVVNA